MSVENVALVRGAYEAFGEGDVPGVQAVMAPDIEWHEAENFLYADKSPYVGPDAVAEGLFARIAQDWEYWEANVDQLLDAGDKVIALGRYRARHSETGSELDAQFAHVWSLKDDEVTRFQQYTDTAAALEAAGVSR